VLERLQSCLVTEGNGRWLKSPAEKPCESGHKSVRLDVEFIGSVSAHPLMPQAPLFDPATACNQVANNPQGLAIVVMPSDVTIALTGVRSGPSHGLAP
jgi:hypothetical protein